MLARLFAACTCILLFAAAESPAGVAPRDPGEVKDFDPADGSSIFGMRFPKDHKGRLATCRVCGKPLAYHLDPNFVCRAPGRRVRSAATREAVCPVCANGFEAPVPDPDPGGDIDRDFCRHLRGTLARAANVWMCPRCGYAAFHWRFTHPVEGAVKKFVAETITQGTKSVLAELVGFRPKAADLKGLLEDFSYLKQSDLPEFLKYENALAIRLASRASHNELAWLYLEASHAYRRLVNAPVVARGLDRSIRKMERLRTEPLAAEQGPVARARAARRLLARAGPAGPEKPVNLTNRDRLFLHIRLAGLHDRLGEVWWASKHLRDAEELASRERDERVRPMLQDLVRVRAEHLKREVYHQERAAERFRRALAGAEITTAKEQMLAIYLVGELLTRTGRVARAVPWFEATVALGGEARESDERALSLSRWATDRLESAAFSERGGGRVAADPREREFVDGVVERLGHLKGRAAAGAGPPAAAVDVPATAPKSEGGEPRAEPVPAAAPTPPGRPASCREQLANIWKAIEAYREALGRFPPDFKALVAAGLITREAAGGFVCAESGNRLFYRRPPPGSGNTFIVYHADPTHCTCRNTLYSDGAIRQLGR